MIAREPRKRPRSWREQRDALPSSWLAPLLVIEWPCQWIAFLLGKWSFLEVLEYLGTFSVLVALIFYFSESGDRIKQKHYQAWQVINTAQGKGGSGGRIEALQELNADRVSLVAVDASGAFLQGISLAHASLRRANFSAADTRNSNFQGAELTDADLGSANFRGSNMREANLQGARLDDADLWGTDLTGADLSDASMADADLRNADLNGIQWQQIRNVRGANFFGARNAPPGFLKWATQNGAVAIESDSQWAAWQNSH